MDPTDKNEYAGAISGYYDAMSDKYTQVAESARYGIPAWLDYRLSAVSLSSPHVLDLGCANGYLGAVVRKRFPDSRMTGVDISPKMIDELKKTGGYSEAQVWDLSLGLPFRKKDAFDIVLAIGFLEFIKDPVRLLGGISSALRQPGLCFASFEVFDPARHPARTVENPAAGFPRYLYSPEDLAALAKSAALRIISSEKITAYVSPATGESRDYHVLTLGRG